MMTVKPVIGTSTTITPKIGISTSMPITCLP